MNIEDITRETSIVLDSLFGETTSSISVDHDDGSRDTVYSTLYKWTLKSGISGEISFWGQTNLKGKGWSLQEEDLIFFICLEREYSEKKDVLKKNVSERYSDIYDKECYELDTVKEKKLFVQAYLTRGKAKNVVYLSYCFKKGDLNCKSCFKDFFEQLVKFGYVSNDELIELKKSPLKDFLNVKEDNSSPKHPLQKIYESILKDSKWNASWFESYKSNVERFLECAKNESWNETILFDLIKNVENGVASLRQKNFEKNDYERIRQDWNEIQHTIKQICESPIVDESACNELKTFLYQRSREKLHSAVNRVMAGLLPNKVSTIAKQLDFNYVARKLNELFDDYPSLTNDWLKDNENFINYCNERVSFEHPWHSSLFAWHLKKYFESVSDQERESQLKMDKFVDLLEYNHNIILHGAPGTGKTYLAKKIAKEMGCTENEIGFVQFHQSYDYTDFVEGLRPAKGKDGKADGFERQDGVFKKFCEKALKNLTESQKSAEQLSKDVFWQNCLDDFIELSYEDENLRKKFKTASTSNEFLIDSVDDNNIHIRIPGNEKVSVLPVNKRLILTILESEKSMEKVLDVKNFFNRKNHMQQDSYVFVLVREIRAWVEAKGLQKTIVRTTQKKDFVFIIDEINRGEISKIFGELFFSIDPGYRGENGRINTQYQNLVEEGDIFENGFFVPENVYIIGTMNDIDRSVESMDFAMRRRFAFKEIKASDRIEMLDDLKCGKKEEAVARMTSINSAIENVPGLSTAYHIGPAYFLKLDNYEGDFDLLWEYHIEGVLREYLRGMPDAGETLQNLHDAYNLKVSVSSEG